MDEDVVCGEPPAWAETRPALCDTIPWFNSLQGGVYHTGKICRGFLVDQDCGIRSYMDEEVVITRVGGGCHKDADGNLILDKDQSPDSSQVVSVINSMEQGIPVGMVIGDRNTLLKVKVPHRYNVMGFFRITNVWWEDIAGRSGAKLRLEKIDISSKSWWAAKSSSDPLPFHMRNCTKEPKKEQCSSCRKVSPQVYSQGWMCLRSSCNKFWTLKGLAPTKKLEFDTNFLNFRTPPASGAMIHDELIRSFSSFLENYSEEDSYSRSSWKGIVCPSCSKCISRAHWDGWKCADDLASPSKTSDKLCDFEHKIAMRPIPLDSVIGNASRPPAGTVPSVTLVIDNISVYPYEIRKYTMPNEVGSITHLVSNPQSNSRPNGPDDMFGELQLGDFGLRRYPLQQSVVAGTHTAHFASNYGMPYKYVVSVASKAFSEAPGVILRALGRLTWATKKALGPDYLPPNELLALGYFEAMKIGYHDDGETSLGPTIASLSLGGPSEMKIRMKEKWFRGQSKSGKLLAHDPVLTGCEFWAERQALKNEFEAGDLSIDEYDDLRREVLKKSRHREAGACVTLHLRHGDIVVMDGECFQKFYEHKVTPSDKLRFALTARYVKPDELTSEELAKGEFTLTGDQVYNGE
ncbi:hypothetical protein P170DRAFT_419123 [Aspergillus steynii IBT 23096]|uniref:Fe2OG dioxygenase domain-containing protein n=1 Tax=Aspergillus steynii IBT 23096 TaxID=1392250 RepID=A0A2I2FRL4_9EURO|nr:uncharacterized protein P170DRAFT_419123 [Aspergillus steynii IBT 23096]PLB43251.1 hypothetical protein P170DRAFT_419123 [Aspergillus steynii IBT 23096]